MTGPIRSGTASKHRGNARNRLSIGWELENGMDLPELPSNILEQCSFVGYAVCKDCYSWHRSGWEEESSACLAVLLSMTGSSAAFEPPQLK